MDSWLTIKQAQGLAVGISTSSEVCGWSPSHSNTPVVDGLDGLV